MIYISYKLFNINTFFSGYVNDANVSYISDKMINIYLFVSVLVLFIFGVILFILMKNKQKPSLFYIMVVVYYFILFIFLNIANGIFDSISLSNIVSLETRRMYRDISAIFTYPQYFLAIFCLIRAVGFDVKRFHFGKDLQELEISQYDSEEFEFVMGIDGNKILVKLRKKLREFKYYFLENTKVFLILLIASIASFIIYTGYNILFNKKEYNQAELISSNGVNLTVLNSYITNLSQNGQVLSDDCYYVVLSVKINSKYTDDTILNTSDFKIISTDNYYLPILTKNNYFIDLGNPYNNEYLVYNKDYYFLLIYEIDNNDVSDDYQLKIGGSYVAADNGEKVINYKYVNLNPTVYNDISLEKEVIYIENSNNTLDFSDSILGESYLKLNTYEVTNQFKYTYTKCYEYDDCSTLTGVYTPNSISYNSVLLVLDANLVLNDANYYSLNNFDDLDFYSNFMTIEYFIGNEFYTVTPELKNNVNYSDKVVLEVPKSIINASDLTFVYTIRDKRYEIIVN